MTEAIAVAYDVLIKPEHFVFASPDGEPLGPLRVLPRSPGLRGSSASDEDLGANGQAPPDPRRAPKAS